MRKVLKLARKAAIMSLVIGIAGLVILIVCTPSISFRDIIGGRSYA